LHWTWVVLTAFIVGSGNRGRADVTQKAILRVAGAIVGTLIATALANAFPAHDDWSVVTIFAVLTVALWLRTFSYAYWAAGMTAALALLYGFYGERGSHLLLDRLEGILIGACIGVAAAWLVLPIRNIDVIRRNLAVALAAIAGGVAADGEAAFTAETVAVIRAATAAAELAAGSVRWLRVLPPRWQAGLPYAVASAQLAAGVDEWGAIVQHTLSPELRQRLARDVTAARRALAADAGRDQVEQLPVVATRIATALAAG
ncbi:MAG: FUSC family protein, partial [Mycobacteriales bacterium]